MTQQTTAVTTANSNGGAMVQPQAYPITEARQLSPTEVIKRIDDVKTIMANAMIDGVHYGVIKGCGDKPTLLKAGAEMLAMTFRIAPEIDYTISDLGNGHREYTVKCALRHIGTGVIWAYGVGSCATTESKYKYRSEWVNGKKIKSENKEIADVYNTCLKMAKKRAQIDATLTALSCSHLFTQDLEDYKGNFAEQAEVEIVQDVKPAQQPQAAKSAPVQNTEPKANALRVELLRADILKLPKDEQSVFAMWLNEQKINLKNGVTSAQADAVEAKLNAMKNTEPVEISIEEVF